MFEVMAIQNDPNKAKIYDDAGIDRIFIDLEQIGKQERQKNVNAVFNTHTLSDIHQVKSKIKKSSLLVRINPIHKNSEKEINSVIDAGADFIMLPMFKTLHEVDLFLNYVSQRAKTTLLFETAESICLLSELCKNPKVHEVYVGLNDMHLSLNMSFLFEPLIYGIIDVFSKFSHENNKSFGFGGIGTLDSGLIPGKHILAEHVRLKSNLVILSRAFFSEFNNNYDHLNVKVNEIKKLHQSYSSQTESHFFNNNKKLIKETVSKIIRK